MTMRTLVLAILILLAVTGSAAGYIVYRNSQVRQFCEELSAGMTIAEVREAAELRSLSHSMEPYVQMRVHPDEIPFGASSCRIFFNKSYSVEYKSFQGS